MICQNLVRALYEYEDGQLIAKSKMGTRAAGEPVGHLIPVGYRQTKIDGKRYYLHRLIWLYFNSELPEFIDHIDGNKSNNRIENLRPATHTDNMRNRKRSLSEFKGVSKTKAGKFRARIMVDGKETIVGIFATDTEAAQAYNKAASHLHGEFAYLNNLEGK